MSITIKNMVCIYFSWYVLHVIASHLYVKYCVPISIWGLAIGPFITTASHCIILRWAIINGGNATMMAWGMLTIWLGKFAIYGKN
jgi:hypothetical protein